MVVGEARHAQEVGFVDQLYGHSASGPLVDSHELVHLDARGLEPQEFTQRLRGHPVDVREDHLANALLLEDL